MTSSRSKRMQVLWYRELSEHPAAFLWTPVALALVLCLFMGLSAMLADELTTRGGAVFEAVIEGGREGSMSISFDVPAESDLGQSDYRVIYEDGPVDEEDWNFSREWTFGPKDGEQETDASSNTSTSSRESVPLLSILHNLFLLALYVVSFWYLLGALYNDRRDRSVLFWKSMPVSDWEEVLTKFGFALLAIPTIFLFVSMVTQLLSYGLSLVALEGTALQQALLDGVPLGHLLLGQLQGWILTALWIAPVYAWLLLAGAGARRNPFLMAVVPVVVLVALERLFIGSDVVATAVGRHLPIGDELGLSGMGFNMAWSRWAGQNWLSIVLGLVTTAAALCGCVWLRRHRYDVV